MSNLTRQFIYTIPENILDDSSLSLADIKVYLRIRSFMDSGRNCYAHNQWFAEKCHIDPRSVTRSIATLVNKNYIVSENIKGQRNLSVRIQKLIYTENSITVKQNDTKEDGPRVDMGVQGGRHPCLGGVDTDVHHTISNNNRSNILCIDVTEIDREAEQKTETTLHTQKDFFKDYKKAENLGLQSENRKLLIEQMALECLNNTKCKELFNSKFANRDVTLQDIHNNCVTYFALKDNPQIVSPDRLLTWLRNEKAEQHPRKQSSATPATYIPKYEDNSKNEALDALSNAKHDERMRKYAEATAKRTGKPIDVYLHPVLSEEKLADVKQYVEKLRAAQ